MCLVDAGGRHGAGQLCHGRGIRSATAGAGARLHVGLPHDCRGERVRLSQAGPMLEVGAEFSLYTRPGHPQRPHRALTGFLLFPPDWPESAQPQAAGGGPRASPRGPSSLSWDPEVSNGFRGGDRSFVRSFYWDCQVRQERKGLASRPGVHMASCPPPPCSLHSQNLGATNCPMICFPFSSSGIGGSLWISAVQQASSKEMKCQSPFLQTTPLYVSCFLAAPDLAEIGRSITKQFRAPCKLSSKKSPFSNQFLYSFAFLSLYL